MKHKLGEIIIITICMTLSAIIASLPLIFLYLDGKVEFNGQGFALFTVFIILLAVLAGEIIYYFYFRKKSKDIKYIVDNAQKLIDGHYDIEKRNLSAEYKKVGEALYKTATLLSIAEKAKSDFINDFSHELKTPIVSLRGFAKVLLTNNVTEEEKREYLSIIVSESDRLIDLTASTLMLDRLGNSTLEIEKKEYNVSEQVRKCILMLQEQWEIKRIEILADFEDYYITNNEELISQLFLNVMQNAVKFSTENSRIGIKIEHGEKALSVSIIDEGIGMDEETKQRMFDKYYRGDKSRSSKGNGLGLATVKRIAELCDLKLSVQSSLGHGTNFTIIFPTK